MKIKYLKEGYFKNTEEIKQEIEDKKSKSSAERAILQGRQYIQQHASKRFDTEFTEFVIGKTNSIFGDLSDDLDIKIKEINYFFNNNVLICEFHIGIGHAGHGINTGDAFFRIAYPENIFEIENSLSEEYGTKSKAKFIFEKTSDYAEAIFSNNDDFRNIGRTKHLILGATTAENLTPFCYFLNSTEGINFSNFILIVENLDNGSEIRSTSSDVELNTKFERVLLKNFFPNELDFNAILSPKEVSAYTAAKLGYDGRWESTKVFENKQITGIVHVTLPLRKQDGTIDNLLDIIKGFEELAERSNNFKNVYVIARIPFYIEYSRSGHTSVSSELSYYLDDNYKLAKDNGFDIEDPLNMTLVFDFTGDRIGRIGVFPFIDYHDQMMAGGHILRSHEIKRTKL